MINWDRVKELENDIGPDDIGDIIQLFLSEVQTVIDRLAKEAAPQSLEQDMHFLKGSALNLGFDTLGELCSTAEKLAARGLTDQISVPNVVENFETSKAEFLDRMQAA